LHQIYLLPSDSKAAKTSKLSYRKDDRAMRPIYGYPENFRESLSTPTATFPVNFLMGFCSDPMNLRTKFEVRSFTSSCDNRGYSKNWAVAGYAHDPCSAKFLMGFCSDRHCECTSQVEDRSMR